MEGQFVYEAAVFSLWGKGKAVIVGLALLSDDPDHLFEAYKLFWSLSDRKFKNIAMDEEETCNAMKKFTEQTIFGGKVG